MNQPAYPVATAAAAKVHEHFLRHRAAQPAADLAALPDPAAIETMINAGFWASLQREENYTPQISLAYVTPEQSIHPLRFDRPVPLAAKALSKVAPAVERPGIHLGVWPNGAGELAVWGATTHLPLYAFVLEAVAPGLLVVKHSRGPESKKFVNVAVLQGDQVKVIDPSAANIQDCPGLLTSLLTLESQLLTAGDPSIDLLIRLAVSMRAHRRGGALLVVPAGTSSWRESILVPISYALHPPYSPFAGLAAPSRDDWDQETLPHAVETVAGLTAVDGAAIITDQYELLAFGAKIVRRKGSSVVNQILSTEPVEGTQPAIIEPDQLGGARHLSAAQFTHDQRDAIALVASQDGRFTVFGWAACDQMVRAHRIETLLM
jgi:hypothetical protein